MRKIQWAHSGGLVDYKGEDRSFFTNVAYHGDYMTANYTGPSDDSVWPDYVDTTPVITITDCSGVGTLSYLPSEDRAVVAKDQQVVITASNEGPAGIWSTPITAPDGSTALMRTEKVEGDSTMNITVVLDKAGVWTLTEENVNSKLPRELHFKFSGFQLDCQLPTT